MLTFVPVIVSPLNPKERHKRLEPVRADLQPNFWATPEGHLPGGLVSTPSCSVWGEAQTECRSQGGKTAPSLFLFGVVEVRNRVSLCSLSCLRTHSPDQAGLPLRSAHLCLRGAEAKGLLHPPRPALLIFARLPSLAWPQAAAVVSFLYSFLPLPLSFSLSSVLL